MSQVTIKNARMCYAHLIEPRASAEGAEPKYSVVLLIPKTDTAQIEAIKAAAKAAKEAKFGATPVKGLRHPLRDGDETDEDGNHLKGEEFRNHYFISASSKRQPPISIVSGGSVVKAPNELIVSGFYCNADVRFYGYDVSGSKGVSAGLNAVLITKRGEPLGKQVTWQTEGAEDFGLAPASLPEPF